MIIGAIAVFVFMQIELGPQPRSTLATSDDTSASPVVSHVDTPASLPAETSAATPAISSIPTNTDAIVPAAAATALSSTNVTSLKDVIATTQGTNIDHPPAMPATDIGNKPAPPAAVTPKQTVDQPAKPAAAERADADKPSEAHGKISFNRETYVVSRRDSYAPITISRNNGTVGKVTFAWWTESGSAEEGTDFMSYGRKTETLGNGKRRMTVFVPLVSGGNKNKSSGRVFFVHIGDASNGLTLGQPKRAKVIITD
jgi:hypothetical protein